MAKSVLVVDQEQRFLDEAKKYCLIQVTNIKDMVDALDHAGECGGEMDCPKCEGTGKLQVKTQKRDYERECRHCKGTGQVECTVGADSDEPESWHNEERARERLDEDPLSIQVSCTESFAPGTPMEDRPKPDEYEILLTTGGPASRIVGDLDDHDQPKSARYEYQDWFKPWTEVDTTNEQDEIMLRYAQHFYFEDSH